MKKTVTLTMLNFLLLILSACGHNHMSVEDGWTEEAIETVESVFAIDDEMEDAEESIVPESEEAIYNTPAPLTVENPSFEYYYVAGEPKNNPRTISLKKKTEEKNQITDTNEWLKANGFTYPGFPYSDGMYSYSVGSKEADQYAYLVQDMLYVTEEKTNQLVAELDFSEYVLGKNIDPEWSDFVCEDITYAMVDDGILYVSTSHNTYASACPQNAYITAFSMDDFHVLWKSAPLTCNSKNFLVIDGAVICGYGFSAEDDFIYILDAKTGAVWDKIQVNTAPDYFFQKNGMLFVREYDTNASYEIEYLTCSEEAVDHFLNEIYQSYLALGEMDDPNNNAYVDLYLDSTEKEYHLPNSDIYYRMAVADAALGSRFYVLLKSRDSGKHWYVFSDNPFLDQFGGSVDFVFFNEAFGFASLSHNGGDEAELYVTKDGGKTYHTVSLLDSPLVTLRDGSVYSPYDYPRMPEIIEEQLVLYVGQGADGDYNGGDENKMAKFVSNDGGETFEFVDE